MHSTVVKRSRLPDRAGRVRHVTVSQQQRSIGTETSSQDEKRGRACIFLGFERRLAPSDHWQRLTRIRFLNMGVADPWICVGGKMYVWHQEHAIMVSQEANESRVTEHGSTVTRPRGLGLCRTRRCVCAPCPPDEPSAQGHRTSTSPEAYSSYSVYGEHGTFPMQ